MPNYIKNAVSRLTFADALDYIALVFAIFAGIAAVKFFVVRFVTWYTEKYFKFVIETFENEMKK